MQEVFALSVNLGWVSIISKDFSITSSIWAQKKTAEAAFFVTLDSFHLDRIQHVHFCLVR